MAGTSRNFSREDQDELSILLSPPRSPSHGSPERSKLGKAKVEGGRERELCLQALEKRRSQNIEEQQKLEASRAETSNSKRKEIPEEYHKILDRK